MTVTGEIANQLESRYTGTMQRVAASAVSPRLPGLAAGLWSSLARGMTVQWGPFFRLFPMMVLCPHRRRHKNLVMVEQGGVVGLRGDARAGREMGRGPTPGRIFRPRAPVRPHEWATGAVRDLSSLADFRRHCLDLSRAHRSKHSIICNDSAALGWRD